jgi:hypothetical protein
MQLGGAYEINELAGPLLTTEIINQRRKLLLTIGN